MEPSAPKEITADKADKPSVARRCWRILKRCLVAVLAAILLYALLVLVGLIPVNNDCTPAEDGVEIFLISNPVHADIVVPLDAGDID